VVPGVYGRFYGGALQNQLIYLSVLTSSGSSIPKFSKPNNEYHVQDRPRPCLTYVHFGIKNISLLHPFRLYALYIHPKQAIPLSLLLLWMNLHVQSKSPRPDGSFVILHSNIGRKLNNWELFWCWFKCDLFSRHFGVPASCSKPSIFRHCPRYHFIVICHAFCYLQTQSTSAPPTVPLPADDQQLVHNLFTFSPFGLACHQCKKHSTIQLDERCISLRKRGWKWIKNPQVCIVLLDTIGGSSLTVISAIGGAFLPLVVLFT